MDTGGRNDLSYRVECFKCARKQSCLLKCYPKTKFDPAQRGLTSLAVTISKLEPYTNYKFKVFSNNGVTGQAQKEKSAELYITTDESGKIHTVSWTLLCHIVTNLRWLEIVFEIFFTRKWYKNFCKIFQSNFKFCNFSVHSVCFLNLFF